MTSTICHLARVNYSFATSIPFVRIPVVRRRAFSARGIKCGRYKRLLRRARERAIVRSANFLSGSRSPETRKISSKMKRSLTSALRDQLLPGRLLRHVAFVRPLEREPPRRFSLTKTFGRPTSSTPFAPPSLPFARATIYKGHVCTQTPALAVPPNDEQRSPRNNESSTECSRIGNSPV